MTTGPCVVLCGENEVCEQVLLLLDGFETLRKRFRKILLGLNIFHISIVFFWQSSHFLYDILHIYIDETFSKAQLSRGFTIMKFPRTKLACGVIIGLKTQIFTNFFR